MNDLRIGVSGARGSFSEEAAEYYCKDDTCGSYQLKYLVGVDQVLTALESAEIDMGIFPIENSNGGIVYEAVYAMSKHQFKIEKIFEIDVKHCLLAREGTKTSDIDRIVSHDQALKQCRMYLKRMWSNIDLVEYEDTAKAAKDLAEDVLPKSAAVIAPKKAARLYELDVLEEGIQDLKFNFTTFIVARKRE